MPDNPFLWAALLGLIAASSLPLGALLGVCWRPGDRAMAFFLAFGGGALLAALAVELVAEAVREGRTLPMAAGAVLGGVAFKGLNHLVNRRGGYLRKPSTAIGYWKGKAQARFRRIARDLARAPMLSAFRPDQLDALLPHVLVRELPAGTTIYRPGDPAGHLYVVARGTVELLDPKAGRRAFARLGPRTAFGRLSFLLGTPRGTEAVTAEDTVLLCVPRRPFFDVVEEHPDLWEPLARRLNSPEVLEFLSRRLDLPAQASERWAAVAARQAHATGRFDPPLTPVAASRDRTRNLAAELARAERTSFFARLPGPELLALAERLIPKSAPAGYTFFHIGEPSQRLYVLRQGRVALLDPQDPARRPVRVDPGQVVGRLSFFTGAHHTVTAVAAEDCEFLVLRRKDFDDLLLARPALRQALAEYLQGQGVADYLTRRQTVDPALAADWLHKAVKQVERAHLAPTLADLKSEVGGHGNAAIAILLGALLDNVPEALVIGAGVATGGAVSPALLGSIFLSNAPEALSSAAGLREQGQKTGRILGLWAGLALVGGLLAGLGALTMRQAPEAAYTVVEGFGAGAMLTVVAETMLPEAYQRGGGMVGLSTLGGFLMAVLLSAAG